MLTLGFDAQILALNANPVGKYIAAKWQPAQMELVPQYGRQKCLQRPPRNITSLLHFQSLILLENKASESVLQSVVLWLKSFF